MTVKPASLPGSSADARRTYVSASFGWLTAALACCALMLTGCPDVAPPNGNDNMNDNNGDPVSNKAFGGAETCRQCHPQAYAEWLATPHADAITSLSNIGQDENANCLGCHTVGFGEEDGFVSLTETFDLVGVQCENCHGPAGEHTRNPMDPDLIPPVDLSGNACATCHAGAHHPTSDEWSLSKHAMAIESLRTNDHAQDRCLQCHSQDYRYAIEKGETPPSIATVEFAIECVTCHAPHGSSHVAQMRDTVANVCGECHTQSDAPLGNTPHHPQIDMLTGVGAFSELGEALTANPDPHAQLAAEGGQACAQCHVVKVEVEDPNDGNPNVTGHTFNPFDDSIPEFQPAQYTGCLNCHSETTADEFRVAIQAEIEGRLTALAPYFDTASELFVDPEMLDEAMQTALSAAKFNYQYVSADGSRGVHNPTYARAALATAESIITNLTTDEEPVEDDDDGTGDMESMDDGDEMEGM